MKKPLMRIINAFAFCILCFSVVLSVVMVLLLAFLLINVLKAPYWITLTLCSIAAVVPAKVVDTVHRKGGLEASTDLIIDSISNSWINTLDYIFANRIVDDLKVVLKDGKVELSVSFTNYRRTYMLNKRLLISDYMFSDIEKPIINMQKRKLVLPSRYLLT